MPRPLRVSRAALALLGEEGNAPTETGERWGRVLQVGELLTRREEDLRNVVPEPVHEKLEALAHHIQLGVAWSVFVRNSLKPYGPLLRQLQQGSCKLWKFKTSNLETSNF